MISKNQTLLSCLIAMTMMIDLLPIFSVVSNANSAFSGGNGEFGTPYLISSVEDLEQLAKDVNGGASYYGVYFRLTKDIDLLDYDAGDDGGWMPIGNLDRGFSGYFDGNNKEIKNISINRPSQRFIGVFGYNSGGTICNLKVVDSNIIGQDTVGSIVGSNNNGIIENCYTNSSVFGKIQVGGVTGSNAGTVENCVNSGNIFASGDTVVGVKMSLVGGIVGSNSIGSIIGCQNYGSISGEGDSIGGIAGRSDWYSLISNSYNTSNMNATTDNVGGIVGLAGYTSVVSCYNLGDIEGTASNVGGIFGFFEAVYSSPGSVRNCYNTGNITGLDKIGGIGGYIYGGMQMRNCYAVGNITGENSIGGIAGSAFFDNISKCIALSENLSGNSDVGRVYGGEREYWWLEAENYAFNGMTGGDFPNKSLGESDGESAYRLDIATTAFWTKMLGFSEDCWVFADNELPILKDIDKTQSAQMPQHLALAGDNISISSDYKIYDFSSDNNAKYGIIKTSNETKTVSLYIATFDGNKMKTFTVFKTDCRQGKATSASATIPSNGDAIKIMLWENRTMIPLINTR